MTNSHIPITGIDIRKALLALGENPNTYQLDSLIALANEDRPADFMAWMREAITM